jgi:hypothetical protein
MNDEEILELPPEERLKLYLSQMQESREKHEQAKIESKKAQKAQKKKEKFLKKQKEHKFDIDPKSRPNWKLGERHAGKDFSEKNQSYLPVGDLHATELFRATHLVPRTYEYPEKAFKLTKNQGDMFGKADLNMLSQSGKKIIQDNIKKFDKEVEKRRVEEMKIKVVEFGPRWECNKTYGDFFSVPPTDPYYFFKKDLKEEYLQEKPFLRTSKYGDEFSYP